MKVIIFSHESDIDGLGSIVLGKLAFKNIDYVLASNPEPLESIFREYLNNNKLYNYDYIFITDLALLNPSLEIVSKNNILKNKVKVFDHHEKAILSGLNKYNFTKIEEKDKNGKLRCGTEMFYEYLKDNNLIKPTKAIDTFVEFTRLEDTWDWKKDNITKAHDLALLFNKIGIEEYINRMFNKLLKDDKFIFNDEEITLINSKKKEYENNIKKIVDESEIFTDEKNNKFGITYASYEYRNDISEYIRNNNTYDIDYFIVVAFDKEKYGQKSYRTIKKGFDVNEIAVKHNGGGHPFAAAVSITKKQKEKALILSKREGLKYLAESSFEK